jgi:predicted nucleic acid-binding protein
VRLVLDGSLTLAWYFVDEQTAGSRAVLDQVVEGGAVVPPVWRFEVANALQMAFRRKRIDAGFRDSALAHLDTLAIWTDIESESHAWSATMKLADRHALTVYDASYLELAQRRRIPLATLDSALIRASKIDLVSTIGIES